MPQDFCLPQLGMNMRQATVVAWLQPEGARLRRGEPLVQVETDKAVEEIEAPSDGVLRRILVAPGKKVAVGAALAVIE